jgi:hypothetical protein
MGTQLVVPSSVTTPHVWPAGHWPKSEQPLMGMHTGTLKPPETTGSGLQNDGTYVTLHTALPAQQ